jgi:integrase
MPRHALTSDLVDSLMQPPWPQHQTCYFDTEIKGFLIEHRQTGNGTYYFRYRDAGRTVRLSRIGTLGEISLADARAKAHAMSRMVREGGDPKLESQRFKAAPTFDSFVAERYMPYARARKRSWNTDDTILRNHVLSVLSGVRMNRISRSDILSLHQTLFEKGYAAATCNRVIVLIKFIYNCAIRWEVLPPGSNPCDGIDPFDDHGARERYLTPQEVQRLFNELDGNRNVQVGQVIRLLLYTGARKREILDARWDEIDLDRQLLAVPAERSKSKKPRFIPLSDAAIEILRSLPRRPDVPWVFFNPKTGKPPVSIFYAWDSIREKVGLKDVRLHDLRHSYASFLVNAGRSLYEVQRLLGHQDPKVTMRYAHLSPQAMREAVNIVGSIVGGGSHPQDTGGDGLN